MNSSMTESLLNSTTDNNYSNELRQLPADIRLNLLTGMPNKSKTNSLTSSTNSIGEKSKDAIVRINELIRQNSVQDVDDTNVDDVPERRRSMDVNPIQYYINETNKLTSNLDDPAQDQSIVSIEQDEKNMKQVAIVEDTANEENTKESKKKSKKNLKRSKSESTHDRNSTKKVINNVSSTDENTPAAAAAAKPSRRRFFSRKNNKLKKQV
ncbi:unnamed protein product, partial [Rotaria magnacalcarata]